MHIFPYSARPGTLAAGMSGQVEKSVKQERARCAQKAGAAMAHAFAASCVGSVLTVLFEREENIMSIGHAENYLEVCVGETGLRNRLVPVLVNREESGVLFGEITKTMI